MIALPGPVRQVGFVVPDLDAAAERWAAHLGVGPWVTIRDIHLDGVTFRGEATSPTISIALSYSGEMQYELIAQHDDAPSPYREFLDAGGDGPHHFAWWADDVGAVLAASDEATVFDGEMAGTRFCYFDGLHPGTFTELMAVTDMNRWMNGQVQAAVDDWDGTTDPVRDLA